ncbi:MAG: sulfite exporter TauE/SafE family protein [Methylococcales symbiont of Hymedesmia sp. n. MRB-2018]|nr:MAG: sulfite exporter TauE/SafE family protein [Methylococcales symbiont of Hymedesmia sp. n. MRB-2018]KAF3984450.1 MAG: sulfite exporter TauE/SafE family protein [Methylococcales symbiont of Hymedesmia sp. n. MRB-2018]
MQEFFLLTMLLGAIAGLLAGLFGLGGGVIIVPALLWLFTEQQFQQQEVMIMAVATSLASIILTSISSLISHHKLGNIIWAKVFKLTPGILLGSAMGAKLTDWITADNLKWFFVSYLVYFGLRMAYQSSSKSSGRKASSWMDYLAGNGIGLISSLLGIGGGTLTVPYLVSRQIAMKNAVAISSVCGLPIALSGTITYVWLGWEKTVLPEWSLGYVYLPAFLGITICSILTAPIGAKLANRLAAKKLKRYFSVVILLIAIKMILQ